MRLDLYIQCVLINVLASCFVDINDSKFYIKKQNNQNNQHNTDEANKSRGLTLSEFKPYYKAVLNKNRDIGKRINK